MPTKAGPLSLFSSMSFFGFPLYKVKLSLPLDSAYWPQQQQKKKNLGACNPCYGTKESLLYKAQLKHRYPLSIAQNIAWGLFWF